MHHQVRNVGGFTNIPGFYEEKTVLNYPRQGLQEVLLLLHRERLRNAQRRNASERTGAVQQGWTSLKSNSLFNGSFSAGFEPNRQQKEPNRQRLLPAAQKQVVRVHVHRNFVRQELWALANLRKIHHTSSKQLVHQRPDAAARFNPNRLRQRRGETGAFRPQLRSGAGEQHTNQRCDYELAFWGLQSMFQDFRTAPTFTSRWCRRIGGTFAGTKVWRTKPCPSANRGYTSTSWGASDSVVTASLVILGGSSLAIVPTTKTCDGLGCLRNKMYFLNARL